MKVATAKELKNRTGEVLRRVSLGERILITRRGKPVAVLSPPFEPAEQRGGALRPMSEAWGAIEARIKTTAPAFPTWREAMRWSRRRA